MLGVAAANASHGAVLTAGLAGLAAGAMSMASGEYVSVHSQQDSERADLRREQSELTADPEGELDELTAIYRARGLDDGLARRVAEQLSRGDRLAVHARDELGQRPDTLARPLQAAWVSAVAFALGAAIPIAAVALAPARLRNLLTFVSALGALGVLGALGARAGGAPRVLAAGRVILGGGLAMAVTTLVGRLAGAAGI
jgi:VIT1/CCC1 family predicted Fe2+/Mn2+ transporter